jgi:2-dehydro-3-deoxygluconokinase
LLNQDWTQKMGVEFNRAGLIIVFGEAMIELSDVSDHHATLGVAGDTLNTAVYLARSGESVSYATALGTDSFSGRIDALLKKESIDTKLVLIAPKKIPGLYAIETDEAGERSFSYWRSDSSARYFFKGSDIEAALVKMAAAKLFYFSGITLSIFSPADHLRIIALLKAIRDKGGVVAFDTNYRPHGWDSPEVARRAIESVMPYVSIAMPTLEDEMALFGHRSEMDCVGFWTEAGAEEIVVKAGPRGAFVRNVGWVAPPTVVRPVDTTGAGDSFNGAYLSARLKGLSSRDAALEAHSLAAEVLMTPGALVTSLTSP